MSSDEYVMRSFGTLETSRAANGKAGDKAKSLDRIGHTLRTLDGYKARRTIEWNPQGKRKRGRPQHTWRQEWQSWRRDSSRVVDTNERPMFHQERRGLNLRVTFYSHESHRIL